MSLHRGIERESEGVRLRWCPTILILQWIVSFSDNYINFLNCTSTLPHSRNIQTKTHAHKRRAIRYTTQRTGRSPNERSASDCGIYLPVNSSSHSKPGFRLYSSLKKRKKTGTLFYSVQSLRGWHQLILSIKGLASEFTQKISRKEEEYRPFSWNYKIIM